MRLGLQTVLRDLVHSRRSNPVSTLFLIPNQPLLLPLLFFYLTDFFKEDNVSHI